MNHLRICQINFADQGGGAERIAGLLHEAYRQRGCDASLYVGQQRGDAPGVHVIKHEPHRSAWTNAWWRRGDQLEAADRRVRGKLAKAVARPRWAMNRLLGRDNHDHPGTAPLINALRDDPPDLIHAHNLHGGYFDLRQLPALCRVAPVVVTLHDDWLISDGPAYREMPGRQRRSAWNLRLKRAIYQQCRLRLAAPSQWLLDRVAHSLLEPAIIESRRIPNGVDTAVFQPADDAHAPRMALGIADNAFVVLFVGQAARGNPAKDFATVREAVRRAADVTPEHNWTLLVLGDAGDTEPLGQARLHWLGRCDDQAQLAATYRAANVVGHAAHVENFPTVVLEAMACGRPIVATDVGGIGEQIDDGRTGRLVPAADAGAMSDALLELARDPARGAAMGAAARDAAVRRFDLDTMVDTYLDWFAQVTTHPLSLPGRGLG